MKVVVVGDRETVESLASLGAVGIIVKDSVEMYEVLQEVAKREDVGLILLSEIFSQEIRDKISNFRLKNPLPIILEIPYRPRFMTYINNVTRKMAMNPNENSIF